MNQVAATTELNTVFDECDTLKKELLDGLKAKDKYINPKFFYDEYGSQLFEKIMQLPEYYPSRTEIALLKQYQTEISETVGIGKVLIEPGAGNCEKVQHLLPKLKPDCYMPIDISADFLFECAKNLQADFPSIKIHAVADDMKAEVVVPEKFKHNDKVIFYPGSTIGNYQPDDALGFLKHARKLVGKQGGLLIGVDLQKDKDILNAAYNDEEGITALFNLNILNHVNNLLGSDINVELFEHVSFYNEKLSRIEMHLESQSEHKSNIDEFSEVTFSEKERINTEYSYKYTVDSFSELAAQAGLKLKKFWLDDKELFSIQYYVAC